MTNDDPHEKPDHPGVIAPPPLIYGGFLALGFLLDWLWPIAAPARHGEAIVLAGLGVAIALTALREFRRAKTNVQPHKPSTAIITGGPFAYTRNPLYVALALFHAAIAIATGNVWVLLLLIPALLVVRYFVIAREECYLEAKFGAEYLSYKGSVRRWF